MKNLLQKTKNKQTNKQDKNKTVKDDHEKHLRVDLIQFLIKDTYNTAHEYAPKIVADAFLIPRNAIGINQKR